MGILTTKQRKKLPNSVFAGPGRSYPITDRSHAANAKARAEQQYEEGNLTAAEKEKIDRRANQKLYGSDSERKVAKALASRK